MAGGLVIDRALRGHSSGDFPGPRWEEMLGVGEAAGFVGRARASGPREPEAA